MTKTLEEIKGMNIAVGAPIELTLNSDLSPEGIKNLDNKTYNAIGYYQGLNEKSRELIYYQATGRVFNPKNPVEEEVWIPYIEDITILAPKK